MNESAKKLWHYFVKGDNFWRDEVAFLGYKIFRTGGYT